MIQSRYKAATELRDLGESVGLAALISDDKNGSFFDVENVGFEVPVGIWSSSRGLSK